MRVNATESLLPEKLLQTARERFSALIVGNFAAKKGIYKTKTGTCKKDYLPRRMYSNDTVT